MNLNQKKIFAQCNTANENYIKECLSGYPKYKYLSSWLLSNSRYLKNDRLKKAKSNKIYKRGSLIFVDFGVNVGAELSNYHFAVVLNKKDNKRNNVLTVIPVTSHENYFTVKLDGFISEKSQKYLYDLLTKKIDVIVSLISLADLDWDFSKLKDSTKQLIAERNSVLSSSDAERILKYAKLDPQNQKQITEFMENSIKMIEDLSEIKKKYNSFNQTSYAKCLDIQTISKDRILYINQYDPVGNIFVSSNTLNQIDQSIKENFISFDN